VRALLTDAATLHHHHPVGFGRLAQPVRDDERRPPVEHRLRGPFEPVGDARPGLGGYTSVSSFIAAFKRRFGVTPARYAADPQRARGVPGR